MLQIHIWAGVDRIESQPLLHLLRTAAGNHLFSIGGSRGGEAVKIISFCTVASSNSCPSCVFWPPTTGSETLSLMTQQKSQAQPQPNLCLCIKWRENTSYACLELLLSPVDSRGPYETC